MRNTPNLPWWTPHLLCAIGIGVGAIMVYWP